MIIDTTSLKFYRLQIILAQANIDFLKASDWKEEDKITLLAFYEDQIKTYSNRIVEERKALKSAIGRTIVQVFESSINTTV